MAKELKSFKERFGGLFSRKAGDYVLEFVVLFASISFSLFIDQARKDREAVERTHLYLKNIHTNLVSDTNYYKLSLNGCMRVDSASNYLLAILDKEYITNTDSFFTALDITFIRPSSFPQRADYDAMKSTGVPDRFKNDSLWTDLQNLYEARTEILRMRTAFTENFIESSYLPYLKSVYPLQVNKYSSGWQQHLNFRRQAKKIVVNTSALVQKTMTLEFRNLVVYRKLLNAQHQFGINNSLNLSRKILQSIDRELKQ